jgi:hypothetical protein
MAGSVGRVRGALWTQTKKRSARLTYCICAAASRELAQDGRGIEHAAQSMEEFLCCWRRASAPFALLRKVAPMSRFYYAQALLHSYNRNRLDDRRPKYRSHIFSPRPQHRVRSFSGRRSAGQYPGLGRLRRHGNRHRYGDRDERQLDQSRPTGSCRDKVRPGCGYTDCRALREGRLGGIGSG